MTKAAFTLIELSIVIVVIGVIVGGVLVGTTLFEAARIRATVSQYEKYNTAATTFKLKYNGLPGDVGPAHATQFGLTMPRDGSNGKGDEDGLIEGALSADFIKRFVQYEALCFWKDMAEVGLSEFVPSYSYGGAYTSCANYSFSQTLKYNAYPLAKVGYDAQWQVFTDYSANYFALALYAPGLTWANPFPPPIAQAMDAKIDDGMPLTGKVLATDTEYIGPTGGLAHLPTPAAPAAGVCVSNVAGNPYNFDVGSQDAGCSLKILATF